MMLSDEQEGDIRQLICDDDEFIKDTENILLWHSKPFGTSSKVKVKKEIADIQKALKNASPDTRQILAFRGVMDIYELEPLLNQVKPEKPLTRRQSLGMHAFNVLYRNGLDIDTKLDGMFTEYIGTLIEALGLDWEPHNMAREAIDWWENESTLIKITNKNR